MIDCTIESWASPVMPRSVTPRRSWTPISPIFSPDRLNANLRHNSSASPPENGREFCLSLIRIPHFLCRAHS